MNSTKIFDYVALLMEGVDRNLPMLKRPKTVTKVALLMEGVDRNMVGKLGGVVGKLSPSSWRAWIEIFSAETSLITLLGRPPHGGRG